MSMTAFLGAIVGCLHRATWKALNPSSKIVPPVHHMTPSSFPHQVIGAIAFLPLTHCI